MKSFISPRRPSTALEECDDHVELSKNFVIRSLRRRLWKSCQEDDANAALKIYKASQHDLESWLRQEDATRKATASAAALSGIDDKKKGTNSCASRNGQKVRTSAAHRSLNCYGISAVQANLILMQLFCPYHSRKGEVSFVSAVADRKQKKEICREMQTWAEILKTTSLKLQSTSTRTLENLLYCAADQLLKQ